MSTLSYLQASLRAKQQRFEIIAEAKRPVTIDVAKRIVRHSAKHGGITPARWCVSNRVMEALTFEAARYSAATGDYTRSAPIDRSNILLCGVPVVGR